MRRILLLKRYIEVAVVNLIYMCLAAYLIYRWWMTVKDGNDYTGMGDWWLVFLLLFTLIFGGFFWW